MELVSPIWEFTTCLWDCTASKAAYITHLKDILNSLRTDMEELKGRSQDVKLRVQVAEEQGLIPRNIVITWLSKVEAVEVKVNEILQQAEAEDELKCGSPWLGKYGIAAYTLGKKATKTLKVVRENMGKGEFQDVANQQLLLASNVKKEGFCEMPMGKTVGIESVFEDVWGHLTNDMVGIIGLYGMGGVGKTTLLKRINNELFKRGDDAFDVAIWVVASREATVEAIQYDILDKLRISNDSWRNKPVNVKSTLICQYLKPKKYILMLDDVWERLDLCEVGLPISVNQSKSKVIFTTRSEEVCGLMEAHLKIKVTCLPWETAWDLFQEKVGSATLSSHYEIPRLAQMVAKECDGLPLALITIGRTMASRKTPYEWSHALRVLRKYPSEFSGMGDHVLPILKFSYDSLPDFIIKQCFVYCSLFPEDYEILNNKLVDLWIAEGFLKEYGDLSEARNHGLFIIETLKLACLLESSEKSHVRVKMHDVIRDLALWIAFEYGKCNKKFLVFEKTQVMGVDRSIQDWTKVEKMSFWGNMVKVPVMSCLCPNLSTIFVNDTLLREIPLGLFQFIPFVRVLDLSGNERLRYLSKEVSKLTYLEYLDLSRTGLGRLPKALSRLNRLRHLLLNYMKQLRTCPTKIISGLTNLFVFRMNYGPPYSVELLRNLENLKQINEISIYLNSSEGLSFFLKSEKLQRCARYLRVDNTCEEMIARAPIQLSTTNIKNLEALQIFDSGFLNSLQIEQTRLEGFCNLRHVIIYRCRYLENLDFLVYAPSLENLWVRRCHSLQRITEKHGGLMFSCLKRICLEHLPFLQSICVEALPFPCLERIYIKNCPSLLSLPFGDVFTSGKLELIKGDFEWWNSLVWRHAGLKDHFFQYFENRTDPGMVECVDGPKWVYSHDWPESSADDIFKTENRLHVLRSSMNVWEE